MGKKARGKNRSSKRATRKRKNIVDKATEERTVMIKKLHAQRKKDKQERDRETTGKPLSALNRFAVVRVDE
jgi:hypothetical protein